jgi:tetratricopeptide (TPR) repeat protein
MKPKVFIGSSVEGLNVAYSIQQNLNYDAEITVWDQGVFELSSTTIESLVKILESSDFGIFVFSNDDVTKIRDEKRSTVRDNVLFEFGLFIGKLTRKRVYFVIPMDTDLYLPTDLLGITPGTYDPNREDGSLQAATGPVCHQIRQLIKKTGRIISNTETAEPNEDDKQTNLDNEAWFNDFFIEKDYPSAIKKLNKQIKNEEDSQEELQLILWKAYCEFKINETNGIKNLEKILKDNFENHNAHIGVARIYIWEDYLDKSIIILENANTKFKFNNKIITLLSQCYKETEGIEYSIEFLEKNLNKDSIEITIELCDLLEENDKLEIARKHVHKIYMEFPNNKDIRFKYAKIALELNENEIALFLLKSLTDNYSDNTEFWGYLSNCCVDLNFYDLALSSINKANELSDSKQHWIVANKGNILKNKGLYAEAIKYLESSIELDSKSEYSHDRLANSLKLQSEEKKNIKEKVKEGRKLIRNFVAEE